MAFDKRSLQGRAGGFFSKLLALELFFGFLLEWDKGNGIEVNAMCTVDGVCDGNAGNICTRCQRELHRMNHLKLSPIAFCSVNYFWRFCPF